MLKPGLLFNNVWATVSRTCSVLYYKEDLFIDGEAKAFLYINKPYMYVAPTILDLILKVNKEWEHSKHKVKNETTL